jgi:gliding motility-associated-like protein
MSVKAGQNGDILLSYFCHSANPFSVVCRVDNTGKLVWSTTFNAPATQPNVSPNVQDYYSAVAFLQDNSVLVFGLKNEYANAVNYNKQMYAMQLNYADGSIVQEKAYDYTEINTGGWGVIVGPPKTHFEAEQLADGTYALFGLFSNFSQQNGYLYRLVVNKDLSVAGSQAFAVDKAISIDAEGSIRVLANGQTHIAAADFNNQVFYWYAASGSGNVIRQAAIPYTGASLTGIGGSVFQTGPTRSAYVANAFVSPQELIDVTQAEDGTNSIAACLGSPYTFVQPQSWQVTTGSWNWTSVVSNQAVINVLPFDEGAFPLSTSFLCAPGQQPSTAFTIDGPSTACTAGDSAVFHITTSTSNQPVQWTMDPSLYQSLTVVNDSTVSIVFKNALAGPYQAELYAKGGTCGQTETSLTISVYPGTSLPRYVTLCKTAISLHVGYWFSAYRWQDGSTDSVYTITQPGRYILDVETYCGGHITDTVDAYNSKIGGLGPVFICARDTAIVQVPSAFVDYSWSPTTALTPINDTAFEIYPPASTYYVLSSATTDGCQLKDTIQVNVRQPMVFLGNDTVICQLDSLVLHAGSGFKSYAWSTGASSSSIAVGPAGVYFVMVTDSFGCKASDTISITGKNCQDMFAVPNAFTPSISGVNSIFKPHIEGRLQEFEFVVYDRWGGVEFETHESASGWDGTRHGQRETAGTYAWMCRYKFADQGVKVQKGTVLLIR